MTPDAVTIYGSGDVPAAVASVPDIAAVIARAFADPALRNREISIAPMRATQNGLLDAWCAAGGRDVGRRHLGEDEVLQRIEIASRQDDGATLALMQLHYSMWIRGDSVRPDASVDAAVAYPDMVFESISDKEWDRSHLIPPFSRLVCRGHSQGYGVDIVLIFIARGPPSPPIACHGAIFCEIAAQSPPIAATPQRRPLLERASSVLPWCRSRRSSGFSHGRLGFSKHVEQPCQPHVQHRDLRRDGIEPEVGQRQRGVQAPDPEPRRMHGDDPLVALRTSGLFPRQGRATGYLDAGGLGMGSMT